jgi:multidrug resistance efflux pump
MIVFLTLCYCGVLALLIKFGAIRLNLWWKLSPIVWMLLLLVMLFIPMQWGAPAGAVNAYQSVVEIVPNVTGEVVEVLAKGMAPLKKDDVLFRIDPEPYQAAVDQLKAQLADTKQNVLRLQASAEAADATVRKTAADVELAKANQLAAAATVAAAKAALNELEGKKVKAAAVVMGMQAEVEAAKLEYDRIELLSKTQVVTLSDRDRAKIKYTDLQMQLNTAEVELRVTDSSIARGEADVQSAEAQAVAVDLRLKQLVETELPRVRAKAREADLAANSMIGDEHTSVASVRAQLEKAQFDLKQTNVCAPSDGYVVGASLRPGQRVAAFPVRSWMSFVPLQDVTLGVGVAQYALRYVRPGQTAEVTLKVRPGKVYAATVDEIAYVSSQGQLQPSGIVMTAPGQNQSAVPFGIRLKFDDSAGLDLSRLPGGAVGTAAIYTEQAKFAHVIRRVMIRMEAWINYIKPT